MGLKYETEALISHAADTVNFKAVLCMLQHAQSTVAKQEPLLSLASSDSIRRPWFASTVLPVEYSGQCMLCMLELIVPLNNGCQVFISEDYYFISWSCY